MATEPGADGAEVIAFRDTEAFETWLTDHVDHTPGVWLKLAKKSSGVRSVWQMWQSLIRAIVIRAASNSRTGSVLRL